MGNYRMRKTDHIIINEKDYTIECLHCGDKHKIHTPTPSYMFLAESEAFTKRHKDCLPCQQTGK